MSAGERPAGGVISPLRSLLAAASLDGLVVFAQSSRDPDLAPFVGGAHLGDCLLLLPREGDVVLAYLVDMEREEAAATGLSLLGPSELGLRELMADRGEPGPLWAGLLAAAASRAGVAPGRFAVGGHRAAGSVADACSRLVEAGWSWQSGEEILRRWRKFKPADWDERVAAPAAGVCAAMRAVAAMLARSAPAAEGLTLDGAPLAVGRLREAVAVELARHGLSQPEGNILAAGPAGGVPHNRGSSRHVLQPGEPLIVDLFPCGELFADCTRTFCVGDPPAGFAAAHDLVRQALEAAREGVRPGVRAWDLQQVVCDLFETAGHPTVRSDPATRRGYVHGLGHGVGYELHEFPSFREQAGPEGRLEEGDLFTLEPGLYDAGAGFGVRLEDLYLLRGGSLVDLTPLPLEWDPRSWNVGAGASG